MAEVDAAREAAAVKNAKSTKRKAPAENLQAIQADVASFAASLGFSAASASGGNSAGFDDSAFRKKGPIHKGRKLKSPAKSDLPEDGPTGSKGGSKEQKNRKDKETKSKASFPKAPTKSSSKKAEFRTDDSEKANKVKHGKAYREETNGVVADGPGKGLKKGKKEETNGAVADGPGKGLKKGKKEETNGAVADGPGKGLKKGKKEETNGAVADGVSNKGVKKGNKPEPGSSRIHEVLNAALGGPDFQTTKKRKANWIDKEVDDDQGALRPKRGFLGSGDADSVRQLRDEAQQLLDKAAEDYERSRQNNSDTQWLMQARRSGTSTDRVAAMTVILQENPKANGRTLDALIGMLTSKAGKRHAATGIDALKELFIFNLLPDRKLKYFAQQPVNSLSPNKERACTLVEWIWEDHLKHRYEKYVLALEEATKDTLSFLKEKALKTVYELLKSKPEQERRLLSTLVNKLGDPERKMASNASYLLSGLLTAHPNMKRVVVDEVEAFVFRPHVGLRARYYAAVFLNQIVLSNKGDGPTLAKQLIDLYFSLFKAVTSVVDEEDHDSKNKRRKGDKGQKKGFGKVANKSSIKAKEKENAANFTMEIDSRLLSALLTGVNRALPYIKAEDLDSVTRENSVLFRLVHSTNFNVAVQALMLLHQLLIKSQAISDRFYRALYSVLLSKGLFKSSKAEMFLGLIYKALKSDVDTRRISAFAKRLTQVAMHHPPQFACGSLLLLSEVLKARPSLWNSVLQAEENEEGEHFEDVRDVEADGIENNTDQQPLKSSETENVWPKKGSYDFRHRDPLYCNAHRTCWWELAMLSCHVHPSVAAMAHTLLSGANIVYNGDPLRDLALGVFLERFAEKKPKALKVKQAGTWHGSSLMPPARMGALSSRPVGEEFSSLTEDQIAPEDLVFHKFYVTKADLGKRKLKKRKKAGDEDEDDITGGLLGRDAIEGDDSDEEVDALLEKEADLEMNDEGGSDEDDEVASEEEIELNEMEAEEGSEVDEDYDDSEDDEADALLEAGLEMSSDDDEDDDGSEDETLDIVEPNKSSKHTKSRTTEVKKADQITKPSKRKQAHNLKPSKRSSQNAGKSVNLLTGRSGKRSVFQEAHSDDDI